MKTSNIVIFIVLVAQDEKASTNAQSYHPTLLPGPYAYVKEFDPLTLEYTGDGKVIFRVGFILNDIEVHRFNEKCDDTDLNWRLYTLSCEYTQIFLSNASWTLLNVTESMHFDVWKVVQFHGEVDDEGTGLGPDTISYDDDDDYYPDNTESPMDVIHTPTTTVFVKGAITDTTVYVDVNNVMTVESLVSKIYPDVNELFQEITVAKLVNDTYQEPEVIEGVARRDNMTRADGSTQVLWKANTNMTDAEYNYTVSYSDIVLSQSIRGTFCIGTTCPIPATASSNGGIGFWWIILILAAKIQ